MQQSETSYDLIVIGGGITGAGIALDAVHNGLKVLLLEANDFGSGTSSKSTKLIHGGLRYLKELNFGLVRETGREREILYSNAPHLIRKQKMLLPIQENGFLGKWSTYTALKLYDLLIGSSREDKMTSISVDEISSTESLLPSSKLKALYQYTEYQTDDARLVIEIIKRASAKGATCKNYCKVTELLYDEDQICGVEYNDQLAGVSGKAFGKVVVNATGPWTDEVCQLNESTTPQKLLLSKGSHLLFSSERFPLSNAVYFDAIDGRMIFALPRGAITYVGTTEHAYTGDKNKVVVSDQEIQYLLDSTNKMFPEVSLTVDDVKGAWAGLRPLVKRGDKLPGQLSRKDELYVSQSGLITITGGKLTGYRKMAERVVRRIFKVLGKTENHQNTVRLSLSAPTELKLENSWQNTVANVYGENAEKILTLFNSYPSKFMHPEWRAELQYCIEEEFVVRLSDFVIRRSGVDRFYDVSNTEQLLQLNEIMSDLMGWTEARKEEEWRNLIDELNILPDGFW